MTDARRQPAKASPRGRIRTASLILALLPHQAGAFTPHIPTSATRPVGAAAAPPSIPTTQSLSRRSGAAAAASLPMISNFLGGGDSGKKDEGGLPRDVKEAISSCRAAVQEALQNRMSRMDVEFPVGTKFGVEKDAGGKRGGRGRGGDDDGAPTKDQLDKSDRELARLFVEMFQPVGGSAITVAFANEKLAEAARKRWKGDSSAACRVVGVARSKGGSKSGGMGMGMGGGNKKKRPKGFAAKMAAELDDDGSSGPFALPQGTEVALFVSPGPKELVAIERICDEVGMGTLVVLLNARLSRVSNFGTDAARSLFLEEFVPVFHLAAAPQEEAPGCLLHRSYPGKWALARKPKVGPPKTIGTCEGRPTGEECKAAYDSVELSDVERGVENALENVAGWFK